MKEKNYVDLNLPNPKDFFVNRCKDGHSYTEHVCSFCNGMYCYECSPIYRDNEIVCPHCGAINPY